MAKKGCDLCGKPATMLCESDQAILCWDCDEKVHAANFLVAKHSRTLLCHVCRSPTPWKAAGPKLGPTVSVCRACSDNRDSSSRGQWEAEEEEEEEEEIEEDGCDSAESESESDGVEYYSDSEEDYSEDEADEEEDGENQVVPWSDSPASPSRSRSEENVSLSSSSKRTCGDTPFESEDEDGCCSSQRNFEFKIQRLKRRRMSNGGDGGLIQQDDETQGVASIGTAAIVEKLRRFQQQGIVTQVEEGGTSAAVLDLCKLTRH